MKDDPFDTFHHSPEAPLNHEHFVSALRYGVVWITMIHDRLTRRGDMI